MRYGFLCKGSGSLPLRNSEYRADTIILLVTTINIVASRIIHCFRAFSKSLAECTILVSAGFSLGKL